MPQEKDKPRDKYDESIYNDPFGTPPRDDDPEWLKVIREKTKKFKEKQAQDKAKDKE